MNHYVEVRGVRIGEGTPKICIPIVGKTEEEILTAALSVCAARPDVAEWRADWFDGVFCFAQVQKVLDGLRAALGDTPLLFTFRTAAEGGEKSMEADAYLALNKAVAQTGTADLIDVELSAGDAIMTDLIAFAHAHGVKVIASSHDFSRTPPKDELIRRMTHMQELGADLPKIAVMPNDRADVLTLLSATCEMAGKHADRPIITMSMSGVGLVSRLSGEVFGSALTFGTAGKASAPGQIDAVRLREILDTIHRGI